MSGPYSKIFPGGFERAKVLMPVLGMRLDEIGRLCDAWVERHPAEGLLIHVYTQLGGVSPHTSPTLAQTIERLRLSEHYLRDAEDVQETTYRSFWFRIPQGWAEPLIECAVPPIDTAQRWRDAVTVRQTT